ncbi:hypothetical protein [Streptomyces sp. NBC_00162]|nr:hypothetical protein [Streptomyces sp. NBC_00162]UUU38445.1 hypothetical protein JIW86_06110 [Streptomyces sp. NBC_00162]
MSPDPHQLPAEESTGDSPEPSPELQARAERGMDRFLTSWEADAEEPR